MPAKELKDFKVGQTFSFKRKISQKDIIRFAVFTGDKNRHHTDCKFGQKGKFKKNTAHGLLAGSLFSRLFGMHCPGELGFCLSQTLNYRLPIFTDEELFIKGEIISISNSTKIITLKTEIIKDKKIAVDGIARVILF